VDDIAKLLKECEQGTISRRQLLQALGLTATAGWACGGGSTPDREAEAPREAAPTGARTFPVTHVNHLGYAVADYVKSRNFYIDLFGVRVAWDDGKGSAIEFGDVSLPNSIYIRPVGKPGDKATVGHIAYGIRNFMDVKAASKAEAERRELNPRPDGYAGWSITDPAGYMVQLTPVKDEAMFPGASPLCSEPGPSDKCREGWESGLKNLGSIPKPSGSGFTAHAISPIAMHVPDIEKDKEFYSNFLGMKVTSDTPDECVLQFGQNTLNLRRGAGPDDKPYIERFGLRIENYDHAKVKAELDRRRLNPKEVSNNGWAIADPDGFTVEIRA
jgi:catechol 2,3-dioxygenase-like lactoylglutathione lyase family enzyme